MATGSIDHDQYKLETTFHEDHVIHTTYERDPEAEESDRSIEVKEKWSLGEIIGTGGFGVVLLQKEERGQLRAVKKLHRELLNVRKVDFLRELNTLTELKDYPDYFVQFLGWYEDTQHIFLAMEYIQHGDLGQYLKKFGSKAKSEAKEITAQLLQGLVVLHQHNICHRDLKPQNILVASPSPIWVKITDFGLSKHEKNTRLRTNCGTTGYRAPELQGLLPYRKKSRAERGYTNAVDLWSLGTIVHEILASEIPFIETFSDDDNGDDPSNKTTSSGVISSTRDSEWETIPLEIDMALFREFCHGNLEFPVESLKKSQVSKSAMDFVKELLVADPKSRPSAAEALESPWLLGSISVCHNRLLRFIKTEKPGLRSFFPGDLKKVLYPYARKAVKMVENLQREGCPGEVLRDMLVISLYDVVISTKGSLFIHHHTARNVFARTIAVTICSGNYRFLGPDLDGFFDNLVLNKPGDMKKPLLVLVGNDEEGLPMINSEHVEPVMVNAINSLKKPPESISLHYSYYGKPPAGGIKQNFNKLKYHPIIGPHFDFQLVSDDQSDDKRSAKFWHLVAKILLGAVLPAWRNYRPEGQDNESQDGEGPSEEISTGKTEHVEEAAEEAGKAKEKEKVEESVQKTGD